VSRVRLSADAIATVTATSEVVNQALAQVQRGFAVFALGTNSKQPITMHGFKDATADPRRVQSQLALPGAGNYGITWPTDAADCVLALDLDNGSDGRERPWQDRLLELIGRIGPLPATKSTTTPSGGRHAFYRWPPDIPVPGGDELFGFTVRWPGRGYLVGPGSSINGMVYLAGPVDDIVELPPAWVAAAVAEHRRPRGGGLITVTGGRFEIPERITGGKRYAVIRDYVASRYNSGLSTEELWELVRTQVAPHFTQALDDRELRDRFDRAVAKIGDRLGPPRNAGAGGIPLGPLEVSPLTEFDSRPIEWVWPSWLPRGVVTIMDGNPGVSKSTLVADLVARLSRGLGWPDGQPMARAERILWITTEDDSGRVLRPRIEAAGGDPGMVLFVRSEVVFPTVAGAFTELLVQCAASAGGLGLVVLDPLFSHIEATVRTIADAEMRRGVMNPLTESAEAASTAVLVVRHFNKDTSASAINRGAGSLGGIVGAARALWSVTTDPEDETGSTKAIGVSKLNYAMTPPAMRYRVESRVPPGWVSGSVSAIAWIGQANVSIDQIMGDTPSSRDAQAALEQLLANGPVDSSAVLAQMKARGFGRDATRSAKARLGVTAIKTAMSGGWVWSLAPAEESEESAPDSSDDSSKNRVDLPSAPDSSGVRVEGSPEESEESEESAPDSSDDSSAHARARGGTARFSDSSDSSKNRKSRVADGPPHARARGSDLDPGDVASRYLDLTEGNVT